ncbi:MAG: putative selenium-dependent hydroxylase accessory protein YqeC [Lachnospiraceae bacterium]|nr:putative selenium-dependent hydroxylase accessory protein YqeC [Lachnospiraceae bacterium]
MGQALILNGDELQRIPSDDLLDRLLSMGRVISLVGAGGKTTLLYALADRGVRKAMQTLVTTSTRILHPGAEHFCSDLPRCRDNWDRGIYAVWGTDLGNGKIGAPPVNSFELTPEADLVLVEADGSRRLPCKAPAVHEPQIPAGTDLVIGVLGLSAIGQPLKEACLRVEETACLLSRSPDHILTGEDLIQLISSPLGQMKDVGSRSYFAILNQGDTLPDAAAALSILRRLAEKGISGAITCFEGNLFNDSPAADDPSEQMYSER